MKRGLTHDTQQVSQWFRTSFKKATPTEIDEAINYYTEYFDDLNLGDYDEVPEDLRSPRQIASEILMDTTMSEKNSTRNNLKIILLSILALPVALPLSLALFAVVFAIFVALVAIIFAVVVSIGAIFIRIFAAQLPDALFMLGFIFLLANFGFVIYGLINALITVISNRIKRTRRQRAWKESLELREVFFIGLLLIASSMVLGSNPITVFTSRIQSIGGLISDGVKTESFDLPKEIDIEIDYSIGGFIIKQTDDDKASITFPYSENNDFEIKTEVIDQKLTVKFEKHRSSWLSFGSFNIEDTILNLPKDTKITDLDVDLKLGSLTMIEIKSDQSQIKLNMGSLDDLSGIHQKANWKLNMGSIKLRGTQLDNAKLDLDMGSLEGKQYILFIDMYKRFPMIQFILKMYIRLTEVCVERLNLSHAKMTKINMAIV